MVSGTSAKGENQGRIFDFEGVSMDGRGILGDQLFMSLEQFSYHLGEQEMNEAKRPGPLARRYAYLTLANWFSSVPEYQSTLPHIQSRPVGKGRPAHTANTGAITTGVITAGPDAKSGTYRLICSIAGEAGAGTAARFNIYDPDGIYIVQQQIGSIALNSTPTPVQAAPLPKNNNQLSIANLQVATEVAVGDEWEITVIYKDQGTWIRHNNSIYIKKTDTLIPSGAPAPGAATDGHWALLVDASTGAKGQDGLGGLESPAVSMFGPIYRRTNSATRPATPANNSGTITMDDGITAAPTDWGATQLQPTSTAQYVYVSFALFFSATRWLWLTPFQTDRYQAPNPHVKGDWSATVNYIRGDIIVSHGTLCILANATSLNEAPETNPNIWIRIRNAAVPWRTASTYAFGEHVSQHGKLYVLTVTSSTGVDPSSMSQTDWARIGGPAEEHVEGILTRSSAEIYGSDELELDPDVNTLLLASASVPTETEGRFDDRLKFTSSELNDSESTIAWFTPSDLDALTASDTYSSSNSLQIYSDPTNGTFRVFKIANGNLVIRKTAGTGTTEFEVYIDHFYFTESMDRVQEALKEIVGATAGNVKGAWSATTTYSRGDIVYDSSVLWMLYGATTLLSGARPATSPTNWQRIGRVQSFNSANTYRAGDMVIGSDAKVYVCVRNANTSTNPVNNDEQWVLLDTNRPGLNWNSTRAYIRGNIVYSGSNLYICVAATSTGTNPTTEGQTDWQVIGNFTSADRTKLEELEDAPKGILTKHEDSLVSENTISIATSTNYHLLNGGEIPAITDGRFDDRFHIRAGHNNLGFRDTWISIAALRALTGNDGFNNSNAILVNDQTTYTFYIRRIGSGALVLTKIGGTGSTQFEIYITHHYFTETVDRVEEAVREMTDTPDIPDSRLLPATPGALGQVLTETSATAQSVPGWRSVQNRLPALAGQFGVYRRETGDLANILDLSSGRLQFYRSSSAGGTEGTDRVQLTSWNDILGSDASKLGLLDTTQNRFMILHKTEYRGKDLRAFYRGMGQNYWTYPLQFLLFADFNQWILYSGNLIGNSAAVGENHLNFRLERVLAFDLSGADGNSYDSGIPFDLQIKWGYQADTDTVPAQRVEHSRYRLGGANQPTLPTLGGWDGEAFTTGNANQTTEQPPSQDESLSTHLWIFTAISTRTAGPTGTWSTTTWAARRGTDPDSTTFSAQWSPNASGGPWYNSPGDAGNSGYMRFRLDNGDWFGPVPYGALPNPPTLQVEYSATRNGTYTSTERTEGYYRFKLSTETTWSGPFLIASTPPTIQVEYSANNTGPWSTTVRTTGYYRFKLSTETSWTGPFAIANNTVPTIDVEYSASSSGPWSTTVRTSGYYRWKLSTETSWTGPFEIADNSTGPVPTLEVQYSATQGGTYTSTVRTSGFYQFRYNNGPWIGPAEIGATPIPAVNPATVLGWSNIMDTATKEVTAVGTLYTFPFSSPLNIDSFTEIEFGLGLSGADDGMAYHRVRSEEVELRNQNSQTDQHHNVYLNYNSNEGLGCVLGRDPNDPLPVAAEHQCGVRLQLWRPFGVTTGRTVGRVYVVGFTAPSTGTPVLSLKGR